MPEPIGGVQPFAELARGGAAVVYKGYRRADNRLVLLKTVRPEHDDDLLERFEDEARLAAQVCHPNVVSVFDAGRDGATAYLVTEFVEGLDLGALIEQGPLPPSLAAYVLHEAAQGLSAVHAEGILHRDLKPANILISTEGAVKLADFGLASLAPSSAAEPGTADLEVRGTLGYLAPEIVRGEPSRVAADLFSLGAILTEMLTGRPAFAHESTSSTLDALLHHDPTPTLAADPRVPSTLADLAADLLNKNPQRRPPNAAAVVERLASIRAHAPAEAQEVAQYLLDPASFVPRAPSSAPRPDKDAPPPTAEEPVRRRRPRGWTIAASVLALVLLGVVGMRLMSEQPTPPPPVASSPNPAASIPADSAEREAPTPVDTARRVPESVVALPPEPESSPPPEVEPEASALDPDGFEDEDTGESEASPEPIQPLASDSTESSSSVEAVPGMLVVIADPWARVRVDGEDQGTTPLGALSLAPGRHTVTLENPDFPPYSVAVNVESGEEERLAVSLWDLVGRVTLVVSPWAEVAVNGTYWDTVPPQERPLILPPGTHQLAFTHPTFGTREETLRIAAGESRTLRINLTEGGS